MDDKSSAQKPQEPANTASHVGAAAEESKTVLSEQGNGGSNGSNSSNSQSVSDLTPSVDAEQNAEPSETVSTSHKKTWKERIFHEAREIGIVILYLFTSFAILQTFRCATLLARCSENDFIAGYTTAAIGALLLGKFVFVLEKMRITNRFKHKPLLIPVLYKTVLFTILVNLILHAEDRVMHHPPQPWEELSNPSAYWPCYFTHQLGFFMTFFIFFCFREIGKVMGEGKLFKLFFVSRDL